jgi:hypothetical protein
MLEEVEAIFKAYKSFILWLVGLSILISVSLWFMRANHVEDARVVYEEYQEIYNTCQKLNTDLCNMNSIPENDKMFEQFSKAQRILAIKTQLNRWVEEYNAKSKMFSRQLWKSGDLPYQLSVNQFNCN